PSGFSGNNVANDVVQVIPNVPDLTVSKTHAGNFQPGQTGARYTITVTNTGIAPTTGVVTVNDTLPAGLTATAISGTGWTCTLASLSCTRSNVLAAGATYPSIFVTVSVSAAAAAVVYNAARVSGGGDAIPNNNMATDLTRVVPGVDLSITKSHGAIFLGQSG